MSVKAGAVYLDFGMRTEAFKQGMARVNKGLQTMQKRAAVAGAAIGAAMTAAAGAMAAAVNKVIGQADQLGYVADNLGVSVEALQEMRFAAERSNMAIGNFDVALRRFIRRTAEAAQGTGAAKSAVEELGIQLRDNDGRLKSSETLLSEVADAIMKVGNQADRLRLAQRFFDTDAAAMLGVFSSGLNEAREQARGLGIVMSEDTVRAAQAFRNNLDLVSRAKDGLVMKVTAHLLPALESLSEKFVDFTNDEKTVQAVADGIGKAFEWIWRMALRLKAGIISVSVEISALAEAAQKAWEWDFSGARDAWNAGQAEAARILADMEKQIAEGFTAIFTSQGQIQRRISAAFGDMGREAGEAFGENLVTATGGKADKAANRIKQAYDRIVAGAKEFIRSQQLEASLIGMSEQAAQALRFEFDLLNDARRAGIDLTPLQESALRGLATAMAAAEAATKKLCESFDFAKDVSKGFFADMMQGIKSGEGLWKSFANAALNALDKIAQKLIDMALDELINGFLRSPLGAFGGAPILNSGGGFKGMIGYSSGTANTGGRRGEPRGIVHGQEAVIPLPNGGRVPVHVMGGGAANENVNITVNVKGASGDQHIIDLVNRGVSQGLAGYDKTRRKRWENGAQFG